MAVAEDRPLVVATAFPASGHVTPILRAVSHLTKNGIEVWFVCGEHSRDAAVKAGVTRFFAAPDTIFIHPDILDPAAFPADPSPLVQLNHSFVSVLLRDMKESADVFTTALEAASGRRLIVLGDSVAPALLPHLYGAPLPKGYAQRPPFVSINSSINYSNSDDVAGFGYLGPGTPREVVARLNAESTAAFAPTLNRVNAVLAEMGCSRRAEGIINNVFMTSADVTLQLCSPSLEFERSDPQPKLRLVGGLPPDGGTELPEGALEILEEAARAGGGRRRIVFVTQGTAHLDYSNLIIPTMEGLAARDDLIVFAALGRKGGQLPEGVKVPANARVYDWVNYNALLPYTDVFVTNAGYGGFMQGVMNGVPMVTGGDGAEKPDVSLRMEYAGLGVNLKTGTPTAEQVAAAVDTVLSNDDYKKRAVELKEENERMDSLGQILKVVQEFMPKE